MLRSNSDVDEEVFEEKIQRPCQRKRSNSLGHGNYKESNLKVKVDNISANITKCASSNNICEIRSTGLEADVLSLTSGLKINCNNLFEKWFLDKGSVKTQISQLHAHDLFRIGYGGRECPSVEGNFPGVMFLVSNGLKVDNEYEIYSIKNYDLRISEFVNWSEKKKKEVFDEYQKGLSIINQKVVDITKTEFGEEDNLKILDEGSQNNRRHSDVMGLMVINKSQPITTFLPNRTLNSFDVVNKVGDVIITDPTRRTDKSLKHVILTNDLISIFTTKRGERLKYKFLLKHLYCESCNDNQIPNIDSSFRIGGPFGDDLIMTFSDPNCKIQWNNAIKSSISAFLESFKSQTTEITVWKDLEQNSSAPLASKTFTVNGKTTGLELKKKTIEGFNQNDKTVGDFILTFNWTGSNREFLLHDDVIVMVLQEHIGCFGEVNSCTECCTNITNTKLLNRTHFYLKYNPARDTAKVRKPKPNVDIKITKTKPYILNEKWPDNMIPEWLMILFSDIFHEGSQTEGIFRMSGAKSKSDEIIQRICDGSNDIEIKEEIHVKANVLKKFFSVIDGSIFTFANKEKLVELGNEIRSCEEFQGNTEQITKILDIIQSLPQNNYNLLQTFLVVIDSIRKNESVNKMNLSNLSVCLAPSVLTEMNKTCQEDFLKTNTIFECILSLFDKIVNDASQKRIEEALTKRKLSLGSISITTSTDETSSIITGDRISISSESITRNDKNKLIQPTVPTRLKRQNIDKKEFMDSDPLLPTLNTLRTRKTTLQDMRNSFSEELSTDQVDSSFGPSKPKSDVSNILSNNMSRSRPLKKKRSSLERHTLPITDDKRSNVVPESLTNLQSPETLPFSPFRRQNQVNRKHRDHSLSSTKINVEESPKTDRKEQNVKLNRKPDKTILDKASDRTHYYKQSDKSNQNKERFFFETRMNVKERASNVPQRSSSQSRIPTEFYDIDGTVSKIASSPNEKQENFEIENKYTKNNNVLGKKTVRSRYKVMGVPRSGQPVPGLNFGLPPSGRGPLVVKRRNTLDFSVQDEIKNAADDDITFV